ncbi:beta-N-acetylhexosaminidase [Microbulbifer sp. HZ11]|uniref:beta-N-acetylhexosaminidase n=1 Tax=Microbulbifer sp. HZ11 TaxID=1453501 RepID=UPI00068C4FDB|nr:family 20 glycosylhydrolase [Microbulbifer sp. HZ11]
MGNLLFKVSALTGLALALATPIGSAESTGRGEVKLLTPLMPYPRQIQPVSADPMQLDANSQLCFAHAASPKLIAATERFRAQLQRQRNIALQAAVDCKKIADNNAAARIEIAFEGKPQRIDENTLAALDVNREFYRLHIEADKVRLSAHSDTGLLHGLQTLSQLSGVGETASSTNDISLPAVEIVDYPRFRWRGVLLDSSRHFLSVDTIKRQLDGMAAAKLNVFHWHLTDDQGWRLESRAYPKLHQTAPGGNFYTWEQVREIVAYAAERGIVVVPEIDMPGHASAIAVAYPELMSAPGPYQPEDRWGVHKPLLNPANPAVYTFAEKILGEVADLFPFEYVHIGGDEVDPEHWEQNPQIQRYMEEHELGDSHALHNYFNSRLAEILKGLHRKMIGWDETLHPDLAPTAAVQSWRGPDALGEIARAGHYGILSTGFYVDQPQYTSYHYRNNIIPAPLKFDAIQPGEKWQTWQFEAPRKRGSAVTGSFTIVESSSGELRGVMVFNGKQPAILHQVRRTGPYTYFRLDTWMGPLRARVNLQNETLRGEFIVGNAPYHPKGELIASNSQESKVPTFSSGSSGTAALNDAQKKNILGGEAALWAEMVDEHNIDLRLWPRTFAVAERLWSDKELKYEDFLYQRLSGIDQWAETALGLQHNIQQTDAQEKLFPKDLQAEALAFSAVLEPAHYYHRHHEKSANETYSRRDSLHRFADSLPVESMALRDYRQLLDSLPENSESDFTRTRVLSGLESMQRAGAAAEILLNQKGQLSPEVQQLAEKVQQQLELTVLITERYQKQQTFSESEEINIRTRLAALKGMHAEVTLPAVYILERLLDQLQYALTKSQTK